MQICMDHWTRLRTKVNEAGLGGFVAPNGEEMGTKLAHEAQDGPSLNSFDPLMGAFVAITNNLLSAVGPAVMQIEGCPLCAGNEAHNTNCEDPDCTRTNPYDDWLDYAVADQLAALQELQT